MNITIISIGKFKNNPQKQIFETYLKRTKWNILLKELEVKSSISGEVLKQKEGELLISATPLSSKIILLDEKGKNLGSNEFAGLIAGYGNEGNSNLSFIIGGANGISENLKKRAHLILSLGKLTFRI